MKRFLKFMMIMAGVCAVAGIISCSVGAAAGARVQTLINRVASNEFPGLHIGNHSWWIGTDSAQDFDTWDDVFHDGRGCEYSGSTSDILAGDGEAAIDSADVKQIGLSLGAGEVTIKESRDDQIHITTSGVGSRFACRQNGTDLMLVLTGVKSTGSITVSLPASFRPERFELELGAGTLNADAIRADNLDIQVGAGTAEIGTIDAAHIDIQCGAGTIDCTLLGAKTDYSIDAEVGAGTLLIDNQTVSGLGVEHNQQGQQNRNGKHSFDDDDDPDDNDDFDDDDSDDDFDDDEIEADASGRTLEVQCGLGDVTINFTK